MRPAFEKVAQEFPMARKDLEEVEHSRNPPYALRRFFEKYGWEYEDYERYIHEHPEAVDYEIFGRFMDLYTSDHSPRRYRYVADAIRNAMTELPRRGIPVNRSFEELEAAYYETDSDHGLDPRTFCLYFVEFMCSCSGNVEEFDRLMESDIFTSISDLYDVMKPKCDGRVTAAWKIRTPLDRKKFWDRLGFDGDAFLKSGGHDFRGFYDTQSRT